MAIQSKLVQDFDDFLKLREPWNELVRNCDVDHAFMRHEWFECWVRHLGTADNLRILTVWSDGLMVAAAPLQMKRQKLKGMPLRVLSFMSSSVSPRCNFILHSSCDSAGFFNEVFAIRAWDLVYTENLEVGLATTNKYLEYLKSGIFRNYDTEPGRQSPHQILDTDWDSYLKTLSKNHRKNIRAALRRLEELGEYEFLEFETYEGSEIIFEQMVVVSGSSWKSEFGTDLKSNPKIAAFYKDFSRLGSREGLWKLYMLRIGNALVAFDYLLKHNNSLTGIRSDYDPAYKDLMPGHLMKVATIRDLCSRGVPWEYDMGGMAAEYKKGYVKNVREHINVTACSFKPYGQALMFGKKVIWPLVKKFKKQRGGISENSSAPAEEENVSPDR